MPPDSTMPHIPLDRINLADTDDVGDDEYLRREPEDEEPPGTQGLPVDWQRRFQSVSVLTMEGVEKLQASTGVVVAKPHARHGGLVLPSLNDGQLMQLGRKHTPPTSWGTRAYIWQADGVGWMLSGEDPTAFIATDTASSVGKGAKPSSEKQKQFWALDALVAGAEVGDINSLFLLHKTAKSAVFHYTKRYHEFAGAMDRYTELLRSKGTHRSLEQDLAYFGVEAGEAHEAASQDERLSARVRKEESRKAVVSYKAAALDSVREGGGISPLYPAFTWTCLGLALKRKGEFSMAQRAYRWGLKWCTNHEGVQNNEENRVNLIRNLAAMWMALQASNREEMDKESLQRQADEIKNRHGKTTTSPWCTLCKVAERLGGGALLQCSGCRRAYYCSAECQKNHWKEHKEECKRWKNEK